MKNTRGSIPPSSALCRAAHFLIRVDLDRPCVVSPIDAVGIWWFMGCISSKHVAKAAASPVYNHHHHRTKPNKPTTTTTATVAAENGSVVTLPPLSKAHSVATLDYEKKGEDKSEDRSRDIKKSKGGKGGSFRLGFSQRYVEAEQIAAGWPSWLSSAAGEAVHGWVPLRADSFEKLEKIGQGTYSSVFRAREVESGKMVALKKVRFDNFQPESIRFMAREIMILRRLEHPNIMQLEGIITSKMSSSIYLVFEYMEHDLAGLVSSPNVKFSEAQIKCYMRQLLSAIEHCHLRGIMHRDIKASNILVNNEGVLKLADFGLANVINSRNKQALTSRVVTLWYRPPELLMGSTDYGLTVDLWSIGCVFAELHLGKPLLKGRTEVEQLHKIFKLCGSPPEEFWKKTKLPHAAMFKPQHSYESSLNEKCKEFAPSAVSLLESFLAIEPYKRGTASSALMSEYFKTKPYACDPSTLPKYPPNKEMDAKNREDARRKRANAKAKETGVTQRPRRVRRNFQELNSHKVPIKEGAEENIQPSRRNGSNTANLSKEQGDVFQRDPQKQLFDTTSESQAATAPNQRGDSAFTAPIPVSASSGFSWVKKRKEEATSAISDGLKSQISALDPSFANYTFEITKKQNGHTYIPVSSGTQDYELRKHHRRKHNFPESFDASEAYPFLDMSNELYPKPPSNTTANLDNDDTESHIEFSGPLLTQPHKIDEILQRNESHIRRVARKSRAKSLALTAKAWAVKRPWKPSPESDNVKPNATESAPQFEKTSPCGIPRHP
ncbi:putative serine/threonine-protein kinase [Cucumis melo var. makuwa]|uniref:Serine/threonine-protein kinase n=1 Tax=Cucumis melo var. makuwa TaxID=1194695 RepID=A0A5A7TCU5_CUCMM|nr:putative serine/threonine-protein kinase [Cucumis melo var. makuwa]